MVERSEVSNDNSVNQKTEVYGGQSRVSGGL